jgi:hypothetical protein
MDSLYWVAAAALASIAIFLVWEWRSRDRPSNRETMRPEAGLEIADRGNVSASRSSSSSAEG